MKTSFTTYRQHLIYLLIFPAVKIEFSDKHKLREQELTLTHGSRVHRVHHGGEIKTIGPLNSCYIHNQEAENVECNRLLGSPFPLMQHRIPAREWHHPQWATCLTPVNRIR